jgi:hypothetical protein
MFSIDSASFDNLQLSGSLVGTLSASINFTNTSLTASIISASALSGSGKNARPATIIYGTNTTVFTASLTDRTAEIAHVYTLPANYFKIGDFFTFFWQTSTGETTTFPKDYRLWISTTSTSSLSGATQWGLQQITQNVVALLNQRHGYITGNTTMKILGSIGSSTNSGNQVNSVIPTNLTVPDISSSWNMILSAARSGSDVTRVEFSFIQIDRF